MSSAAAELERPGMPGDKLTPRISEVPNAFKHMDALFDVVRIHSYGKTKGDKNLRHLEGAVDLMDALFAVIQSNPKTAGSRTEKKTNIAKTWKERGLPPSFFDAGSRNSSTEGMATTQAGASEVPRPEHEQAALQKPPPTTVSQSHALGSACDETTSNSASTPAVVVSNVPECLTFYIDKHLQCQVNLEPAVERRRRLARGRVQKYRSRKRRRKPAKGVRSSAKTESVG